MATAERLLRELGLPPYQARVLLALIASSPYPATSYDLAERSGVPRTSVYLTAEALVNQGLAEVVTDRGVRRWRTGSWDDVANVLARLSVNRYEADLTRVARLRESLPAGACRG